jgi:CHASE3 domain sensor protein
MAPI